MTTRKPTKSVILPPVRPNIGIEVAYKKQLDNLIDEMQASLDYWLKAEYKLAMDASPAMDLRKKLRELRKRWVGKFDAIALQIAKRFVARTLKYTDTTMALQLKAADFTIQWKLTAEMNNALQAVIGGNVSLIKSIAEQHLSDVEGVVMRSVAKGGDLYSMSKELQQRYAITKRRAALIARDQNSKAISTMVKVRQEEIGVKQAMWRHSHAGREPRASHIAADKKLYDVSKGMLIDGEYIYPGEKINCRCTSRAVFEY